MDASGLRGEHTSERHAGWMEGALESGEKSAWGVHAAT
jgi:monoamine oxidase